jgi:hypothetical protein
VDAVGECGGEVSASRHQISLSAAPHPLAWFISHDSAVSRLSSSIWRILALLLLRVKTTAPIAVPTIMTITPKVTLDPAVRTDAAIRRRSLDDR